MKKVLSTILAVTLAAVMLAACGGSSPVKEESAKIMDLTGKDMDGNDVRMGDIISANKVTLVNYWGTTCAPCVEEMPGLSQLAEKYKDQGFGVIGLCEDVLEEDGSFREKEYGDAKSILADTGVTYPIVLATTEINEYIDSDFTPVSFFIDSDGNMIGESITGAKSEDNWESIIAEKLSGVE